MPLHGKIVVVKRSGGDGTEFPLTASCLFGRKADCDIRIQLPHVSKEHCRIDLNENKEVILTNLSTVNPTCVNGRALQQSERLKHGDVITIMDRSFRFESPPAATPRKSSSRGRKSETFKVLQDQHLGETSTVPTEAKGISDSSADPHLKDGTKYNIQRSMEKHAGVESKEEGKTASPFSDLYQMIKKSLEVKTPAKSGGNLQTLSKCCTPKPPSIRDESEKSVAPKEPESTPSTNGVKGDSGAGQNQAEAKITSSLTPASEKKQKKSSDVTVMDMTEGASPQTRRRSTPQRFAVEKTCLQSPKSSIQRRSKEASGGEAAATKEQEKQPTPLLKNTNRTSPRNHGKGIAKKRKSGELEPDMPAPQTKKKRVSFGGYLSPELFDKKLPSDSPLRRGATPRRSLCLTKPKQSLLRRASVIGVSKECIGGHPGSLAAISSESPKTLTPAKKSVKSSSSPKSPTPGKKSPRSTTPSPKASSPGKKSPKAGTPAPKKSPKAATPAPKGSSPGKKSPTSKATSSRANSVANSSKAEEQLEIEASDTCVTPGHQVQTPSVQGRFSVSRISTPSPDTQAAIINPELSSTMTPKIPLRRRSMKSISRKTPSLSRSAVKMLHRSGISRASMRVKSSWANIVKFGQPKVAQEAPPALEAPEKQKYSKATVKKAVAKLQTPVRNPASHVSTGHADSPVTIVVGKAHKLNVVAVNAAAPRVIVNAALSKKNLKMDEDLTGILEMFKTPANEKKRRSGISTSTATKTQVDQLDLSVLNTPEGPGEMMVSPLNAASTAKGSEYNSEAVKRLLNEDEESSFVCEPVALENHADHSSDFSDEQPAEIKTASVATPKQKPGVTECLTGVKRVMKTPRQKVEPVEDIRGKLLKTPKQKIEPQECLTGVKRIMTTPEQKPEPQECLTAVKRIMKTPRQRVEPLEDIRGNLLKTPKQKPEPQECLTGVKRIMETPKQKPEPQECLTGVKRIMETPKQKPEPQECLTGVKRIMNTPQQTTEPVEDLRVETPKQNLAPQLCLDEVSDVIKTPEQDEAMESPPGTPLQTPPVEETADVLSEVITPATTKESEDPTENPSQELDGSPSACATDLEPVAETPEQKNDSVEDFLSVERLVKTPKEKGKPVEENFGIKRLMKSPRMMANAPVEDFEGLQELMEEPAAEQIRAHEVEDQPEPAAGSNASEESMHEDPPSDVPCAQGDHGHSDVISDLPVEDLANGNLSEVPSNPTEAASEHVQNVPVQCADDMPRSMVTETDTAATNPTDQEKCVRGRRANTGRSKPADEKQEASADVSAPVRGRRGKKFEVAVTPRATRSRNATSAENGGLELTQEENPSPPSKKVVKPKRGRGAVKVSDEAEASLEVATEKVPEPANEDSPAGDVDLPNDAAAPIEKAVKPKRGSRARETKPSKPVTEHVDVPCTLSEDDLHALAQEVSREAESDQPEVIVEDNEKKPGAMETVLEALPEVEAAKSEVDVPVVQKKPVRGRRAKSTAPDDKQDMAIEQQHCEETASLAPLRGRGGKRTEATAPPAVRQSTRGRIAKSRRGAAVEEPVVVPEEAEGSGPAAQNSPKSALDQTQSATSQHDDCAPTREETAAKPTRGRKTKSTPVEQTHPEPPAQTVSEQPLPVEKPQQAARTATRRGPGRKTNPDTAEPLEAAEDAAVIETTQQPRSPIRAKRGRNAKQTEEVQPQEPVKKLRTRKANQDDQKAGAEIVAEGAEAPQVSEPENITSSARPAVAAKRKRGGLQATQDVDTESAKTQEVPVDSSPEKPKRGRRVKQVEEVSGIAEEPEAEKKQRATAAKKSAIPAKRARRGTAPPEEEAEAENSEPISETTSITEGPAKRRGRAAAKVTIDDSAASCAPADVSTGEVRESSKRSVKWKAGVEVHEFIKQTPVKATRGRKSTPADQRETESKTASKRASKPEEKDLSDQVEPQPAKRGRRGTRGPDEETPVQVKAADGQTAETQAQPKPRRGRSAKK